MACVDAAGAAKGTHSGNIAWLNRLHGENREVFARHCEALRGAITQAQKDAVDQLIPIMLAEKTSIPALRVRLGRATWRQIHHATEATNLLRALVWLRFQGDVSWAEIVAIPPHHLRSCRNALDWPTGRFAAHHAPQGQFHKFAMLYRDVVKMGVRPRAHWTPARLRRERDKLFAEAKITEADATRWASALEHQIGAFHFVRLCSDRDLVTEGVAMRHCVASYADAARAGQACVFRCTGPERATLSIGQDGTVELRGFANAKVSRACMGASAALAAEVFQTV